jgi:two-component system, NarL family, captular synthesis response regulator RcsB
MRIVVADDHPVTLMGVRALLESNLSSCEVVGEAHDGASLLALLSKCPCDLLVTDFSMPGEAGSADGLMLIRQIHKQHPDLPMIILTMLHNPALTKGMLAAGARAVVEKTSLAKELIRAIQVVRTGRVHISESLRGELTADASTGNGRRACAGDASPALSVREAEIMRMFAAGLTVSEIARVTNRSVKTISQQKHDAMRKLHINSDSQLFEYVRGHGL